jgi:hypothetical protein
VEWNNVMLVSSHGCNEWLKSPKRCIEILVIKAC